MKDKLQPRKLPAQLRSKATVDAIFEAAIQVIEKAERDDPSVHAIADRAGVSVGSLYQYFPSKQALASALIGFHLGTRMEALERELEAVKGMSGEEAVARLIDGLIGDKTARLRIEHAMIRAFVRVGDLATLTSYDEVMYRHVERFITSLAHECRPVDVSIAAFLVSQLLRSAVLLTIVQKPERLHDPAFKAELVTMVVNYLKKA
jgi:AcrR family transcriptional regulator